MKIVAINGSHRGRKGYTQFLIDKLFTGAEEGGAACETLVLAEHTVNRCLGCRVCHTQKHYLKCVYDDKDDVSRLFDVMRSADLLVYATPIYIFHMSGLMKTFLDRITSTADSSIPALSDAGLFFHHMEKKLLSKPFVVLACQDNFESETSRNVISYFETFSRFLDAPLTGVLVRTSGSLVGHGMAPEREARYPKIRVAHDAFVQAGRELACHGAISGRTAKKANQVVLEMPRPIQFLLKFRWIRRNRRIMGAIFRKAVASMSDLTPRT